MGPVGPAWGINSADRGSKTTRLVVDLHYLLIVYQGIIEAYLGLKNVLVVSE